MDSDCLFFFAPSSSCHSSPFLSCLLWLVSSLRSTEEEDERRGKRKRRLLLSHVLRPLLLYLSIYRRSGERGGRFREEAQRSTLRGADRQVGALWQVVLGLCVFASHSRPGPLEDTKRVAWTARLEREREICVANRDGGTWRFFLSSSPFGSPSLQSLEASESQERRGGGYQTKREREEKRGRMKRLRASSLFLSFSLEIAEDSEREG